MTSGSRSPAAPPSPEYPILPLAANWRGMYATNFLRLARKSWILRRATYSNGKSTRSVLGAKKFRPFIVLFWPPPLPSPLTIRMYSLNPRVRLSVSPYVVGHGQLGREERVSWLYSIHFSFAWLCNMHCHQSKDNFLALWKIAVFVVFRFPGFLRKKSASIVKVFTEEKTRDPPSSKSIAKRKKTWMRNQIRVSCLGFLEKEEEALSVILTWWVGAVPDKQLID